jgi:hypothetical protein
MQQIAHSLKELGMAEYTDRFVENKIDISVLPDPTDQHLKDQGLALGDRLKILRAIRDLSEASVAPKPSPTPATIEPTRQEERRASPADRHIL